MNFNFRLCNLRKYDLSSRKGKECEQCEECEECGLERLYVRRTRGVANRETGSTPCDVFDDDVYRKGFICIYCTFASLFLVVIWTW